MILIISPISLNSIQILIITIDRQISPTFYGNIDCRKYVCTVAITTTLVKMNLIDVKRFDKSFCSLRSINQFIVKWSRYHLNDHFSILNQICRLLTIIIKELKVRKVKCSSDFQVNPYLNMSLYPLFNISNRVTHSFQVTQR